MKRFLLIAIGAISMFLTAHASDVGLTFEPPAVQDCYVPEVVTTQPELSTVQMYLTAPIIIVAPSVMQPYTPATSQMATQVYAEPLIDTRRQILVPPNATRDTRDIHRQWLYQNHHYKEKNH